MKRTSWSIQGIGFRYLVGVCLTGMLAFISPVLWAAPKAESDAQVEGAQSRSERLGIEGISASVGEDEPRVLNILPWQAPTLPRRPKTVLESSASNLVQPLDAVVLERHRVFRQSFGGRYYGGQPGARR